VPDLNVCEFSKHIRIGSEPGEFRAIPKSFLMTRMRRFLDLDAGPQSEKLGAQQPAMVIGQRAWTNQAHVSAHNVPYLGQVADAVMAKPRAYDGQDARVAGITVNARLPGRGR
jgi:hypothetical protein